MRANTFLCPIECLTRVLPGWMFVRKSEGLMCQVPLGQRSRLRGVYKYPFPSQRISKITCEPVSAARMPWVTPTLLFSAGCPQWRLKGAEGVMFQEGIWS